MSKTKKWIFWIVMLIALVIYPRVFGIYYTNVFITFAIFESLSIFMECIIAV